MKVIDLTQTIHDNIQIYPGDPAPSINRFLTHEKDYCHVDSILLGSHTGTHIDATYPEVSDPDSPAENLKHKETYGYPVHQILFRHHILIVENLCNLGKIKHLKGLYSFLPLKIMDSDGSPIRAVHISLK